ncbi:hypothetical protein HGRIS_002108 [Hohenbuehelia grisea]|uniref:Polysaccharide lyase 14 domain-containing protein n=1 Tax=Hohenbuehelia grisea TaxID=104357 RepID=A0ABR3JJN7_9AGAR
MYSHPPALAFVVALALTTLSFVSAATLSPEALASQYGLATSTSMPFPTATQSNSDAQNLLVSQWSLGKGRIQDGAGNLAFVDDPFPSKPAPGATRNVTGPVMSVTYPAGSSSHDTGGTQLYTLWNTTDGSTFQTMMVTYEVAFDSNFDWVKGGKMAGLRGGINSTGCSGGHEADGKDCFSIRLMWRKNGLGESTFSISQSCS